MGYKTPTQSQNTSIMFSNKYRDQRPILEDLKEADLDQDDADAFQECVDDIKIIEQSLLESQDSLDLSSIAAPGQRQKFEIPQKKTLIYDNQTKQQRYLSPFEQFLSEQTELFKSKEAGAESAVSETNASTNFEGLTLKKADWEDSQVKQ